MKSQHQSTKLLAINGNKRTEEKPGAIGLNTSSNASRKGLFRAEVSMSFHVRCQHVKIIVFVAIIK